MNIQFILSIFSSLIEAGIILGVCLWGLPKLGIHMPWPWLAILMAFWGAYTSVTYKISSQISKKKPLPGLPTMVGMKGYVTDSLCPKGYIKIGSELWMAKAENSHIEVGQRVIVISQKGLNLVVHQEK